MNEPERLLDGSLPAEVASLLRAADRDDPRDAEDKKRRLLAAAASTSPWASQRGRSASSPLRNVAWIGLAAVALVGVSIAVRGLSSTTSSTVSSTSTVVATRAPDGDRTMAPAPTIEPSTAAPVIVPSVRIDDLPSAASAPLARPSSSPAGSRGPTATTTVEDELALIDAARAALGARHPEETLARVQRYRAAFRDPHFVAEADALEVQALAALGRTEEARTKAEQFFRKHPGSPYTQRVRSASGASHD